MDLLALARERPILFLQVCYDAALIARAESRDGGPSWREPGESATEARDRLRRGREEARRLKEGR